MDAVIRDTSGLFAALHRYSVPPYQRPYVWSEERQWSPLWEDIERLADLRLEGSDGNHFLGAVVIRRERAEPGGITDWSVIDGQQRLTTLQLVVSAIAAAAKSDGAVNGIRSLRRLTLHEEDEATGDGRFKFWPTDVNQAAFRAVMREEGPDPSAADDPDNTIEEAWQFFYEHARQFAQGGEADDDVAARHGALREAVMGMLQLVVISLEPDDPAQVIFETLNARGTPLLATDLVKNALFDLASRQGHSVEDVHARYWAPEFGDHDYWSAEIRLGRVVVPRSEAFLMHWLTMQRGEVVPSNALFEVFRKQYLGAEPADAVTVLQELSRDAGVWRRFIEPPAGAVHEQFSQTVRSLDTTVFHPVALLLLRSDLPPASLQRAFDALESFLVRRMICGLTTKDYNKLVGRLVSTVRADVARADEVLVQELLSSTADIQRWPADDELARQIRTHPMYGWIGQARLVVILSRVELARRTGRTEEIRELPPRLQVEHVMPQSWRSHWPLEDPTNETLAEIRSAAVNRLGNLTLVSGSLNAGMSNREWSAKREELRQNSLLVLNREIYDHDVWDESAIDARGDRLAGEIASIWPGPQAFMPDDWVAPEAEWSPEFAMVDEAEVRDALERLSPYSLELITELARVPGQRRTYAAVEEAIGWPAGRLASVFGGYSNGVGRRYGGRRPWRIHLDREGAWWIWVDNRVAGVVNSTADVTAKASSTPG